MPVATIGLDLAKAVFQVHGVDDAGQTVLRRRLGRSELLAFFAKLPPCKVATRHAQVLIIGLGNW